MHLKDRIFLKKPTLFQVSQKKRNELLLAADLQLYGKIRVDTACQPEFYWRVADLQLHFYILN